MTPIRMYDILKKRLAINILKALYDQEFVQKAAHTISLANLCARLGVQAKNLEKSLVLLVGANMITKEDSGDANGTILSLRNKGKRFVEQFDILRDIFFDKKEEQKFFKINYELTALEKRLLMLCYKMQSESATPIPLRSLALEAYPHQEPSKMTGTVSRYITKLASLNLVKKERQSDGFFIGVTESGEKVVKNQLMEKPL
ncbi:hypothetical protein HY772_03635 [Candidatus Woesearchaeota archaeon]|nr:hypothetical protein [Candidatus Woesearchaeota archaeon]